VYEKFLKIQKLAINISSFERNIVKQNKSNFMFKQFLETCKKFQLISIININLKNLSYLYLGIELFGIMVIGS